MEKFVTVTGTVLPLPADNIDTDQIMPKQFLRGIDKAGLGAGCMYNMRFDASGNPLAGSIFHRPGFENAPVILAGPNFGCGSSREHAVWGLQQMGVKVVIAANFGEIFYSNCFNNGLLACRVTPENAARLFSLVSDETPVTAEVDLEHRALRVADVEVPFIISDRHRRMLLEGLDMVEGTLAEIDKVETFRALHEKRFPWMARLAGRTARALG